jgi:hypothetical protein
MTNLLDTFESVTGDLLIRQLSSYLGESAESITSATKLAGAAVLAGLVQQGSSGDGVRSLLDFLRSVESGSDHASGLSSMYLDQQALEMTAAKGSGVLTSLMGDRLTGVIDYLSGHSGLKTSSSSMLLKIVAPVMTGMMAKYIREKSLDRQGVRSLLHYQMQSLGATLPQSLKDTLAFATSVDPAATSTPSGMVTPSSTTPATTFSKILPWLVLLLAALGMFYFVEKGCGGNAHPGNQPSEMSVDSTKMDSI